MAVAVGQRCVVRIKITDVELRQASDIMATIVSPQGEEKCQDISFDEVSGLVYVAVVVNSVGNWSMWLNVRFANEVLYTPAFVFAEVEGEATPCDAPYIVDVEVQGESVSVTPPKVDVDAVGREEFDALAKQVTINTDAIESIGDNTIIVDYDKIAELKASEKSDDVTHPEIAELVEKIYNEQEKLILVRHFGDTYEQIDPTYFVPDTNYGRDEFGNVIITLYASYTPNNNIYGEQQLINLEISITQAGAIDRVEQKRVTLLNNESVIDKLNIADSKKPLSANQGRMLDRKKVGYAEYDSEKKAIMLYSDNTKKYQLGKIPIDSLVEEGYYPNMSVGMADNLVGRGDVQDAQINFRPSAGADNITDGAARIERIKGNSVVWNQGIKSLISERVGNVIVTNGVTFEKISNESYHISGGNNTASYAFSNDSGNLSVQANHYYLFDIVGCDKSYINIYLSNIGFALNGRISEIKQSKTNGNAVIRLTVAANTTEINEYVSCQVIDLTQMFGAGNEPTSYEEYLQRKPMNIEDEFAYNEGELIDMKVDSLVSVGDNAWDEEWENGTFDTTTGTNINNANSDKQIRSKNLIKVLPNTNYTCTVPAKIGNDSIWCMLLDKNKEVITGYTVPNAGISGNSFGLKQIASSFTTPSNAAYLKFYCPTIYGDVYTNDICFHLEHSEYKNGKYYPYQQDVKDLSFISEAFPEGMRSAGSVFDEIRFNKTTKKWEKVTRVGVVDLDEVVFNSYGSGVFYGEIKNAKLFFKGLCNRYIETSLSLSLLQDKQYTSNAGTGKSIWIKDLSYQDVTSFQQSLQGVKLYYELEKPIIEEIDLSPNFSPDYPVWDFGTEEAIASVPSAPFRADINYEPNAVDDLRWAVDEIRKLKAQIAQMQASVTNLTE